MQCWSQILGFIFLSILATTQAQDFRSLSVAKDGHQTMNGLVLPLDEDRRFYLRNEDGMVEVRMAEDVSVGLLFRERGILKMLRERKVRVNGKSYDLPEKLSVRVHFANWKSAQRAMKSELLRGGRLVAEELPEHLPTEEELWLSGPLVRLEEGHITPKKYTRVAGKEFEVRTSGYNYSEQILGLFGSGDVTPHNHQASVYGTMKGKVFHADEVLLRPVVDPVTQDDLNLPRYLFIGDSISLNYTAGLLAALKGKVNAYHPPTNCGPAAKCAQRAQTWLGHYEEEGRGWDVISFNCGHWDAGRAKREYQANLERLIAQLKPTGAKLIWVTTCPVPEGYDKATSLKEDGSAPGRTNGVMKKYLNPWALEVIKRHPEISVCDQWALVEREREGLFGEWWSGKNVHFKGEQAEALGRLLADHVLKRLEE